MKIHANARTCPNSRRLLVRRIEEESWSLMAAAEAAGISERSARKWLAAGGPRERRGSWIAARRPGGYHRACPMTGWRREALRRLQMTAAEIAEVLGMALSTVSRWPARIGLGKRSRLQPPEPPNRYERKRPGELIHVDIKKLGRISVKGAGHRVTGVRGPKPGEAQRERWAAPGHRLGVRPRLRRRRHPLAYVEVLPDEKGATAAGFLRRAVSWLKGMGIQTERVLSDNGACYRSRAHAEACAELDMRHLFTRPYRPQTNGKAERFIQTLINRWAYGAIYGSSAERIAALPGWVDHYNFRRRHTAPLATRRPRLGLPSWNTC